MRTPGGDGGTLQAGLTYFLRREDVGHLIRQGVLQHVYDSSA